jgi:hypothetical protein
MSDRAEQFRPVCSEDDEIGLAGPSPLPGGGLLGQQIKGPPIHLEFASGPVSFHQVVAKVRRRFAAGWVFMYDYHRAALLPLRRCSAFFFHKLTKINGRYQPGDC